MGPRSEHAEKGSGRERDRDGRDVPLGTKTDEWIFLFSGANRRNKAGLNDYDKGLVRILKRRHKFFSRIPPALLEEEQKISVEATVAWREARKKSDFQAFRPYLEKIVALKIEEAEKLGYEKHPYNALLDQYDEGLTVDDMDAMFSQTHSRPKENSRKGALRGEIYFPQSACGN